MSTTNDPPFQRDQFIDKPGIVGARWWHQGLRQSDPVARRTALKVLLAVGGIAVGVGAIVAIDDCGSSDTKTEMRTSLDMQQTYGWNFGATSESLTFDGKSTLPFDRVIIDLLSNARLLTSLQIINGLKPELLERALTGEHVGTIVRAE